MLSNKSPDSIQPISSEQATNGTTDSNNAASSAIMSMCSSSTHSSDPIQQTAKLISLGRLTRDTKNIIQITTSDYSSSTTTLQHLTFCSEHFMFKALSEGWEQHCGWYSAAPGIQSLQYPSSKHGLQDLINSFVRTTPDIPRYPFPANSDQAFVICIGKILKSIQTKKKRHKQMEYWLLVYLKFTEYELGRYVDLSFGMYSPINKDDFFCNRYRSANAELGQEMAITVQNEPWVFKPILVNTKSSLVFGPNPSQFTNFPYDQHAFMAQYRKLHLSFLGIDKEAVGRTKIAPLLNKDQANALDATTDGFRLRHCEERNSAHRKVKAGGKAETVFRVEVQTTNKQAISKNYHPNDPEPFIIKAGLESGTFQKNISLSNLSDCIKNIPKETSALVKGMVATSLVSNLKWTLEMPAPVDKAHVQFKDKSTVDLDQVSLDLVSIGKELGEHSVKRKFKSNQAFLLYHLKHLQTQVFGGTLPKGLHKLNYPRFCNPNVQRVGGHTFMRSDKKKKFTLITDGSDYYGEVMRVGVCLHSSTRSGGEILFGDRFDAVEMQLLENYHLKPPTERIFIAMILVAKFLNEHADSPYYGVSRNSSIARLGLECAKGKNDLECCGGIMLYLLASIQVAALEEWNKADENSSSNYSVSVSLETYGGKMYESALLSSVDDKTDKATQLALAIGPKVQSAAYVITQFSTYFAKELKLRDETRNNMYLGVGFSCWAHKQGLPIYVAYNNEKLKERLKSHLCGQIADPCQDNNDEMDTDEPQDKSDLEANIPAGDIDTSATEFQFPQQGRLEIRDTLADGSILDSQAYPTWAGFLQPTLQPVTMQRQSTKLKLKGTGNSCAVVKVQHYSVPSRYAIGECHRADGSTVTGIAAGCMKQFSIVTFVDETGAHQEYRYDHHAEHLDNAYRHLLLNCDALRAHGHAARLELGFKSVCFDDHNATLKHAAEMHLRLMDECLEFYDIVDSLATVMEFFGNGLRERSDFSVRMFNRLGATDVMLGDMFANINEECAWWLRWYSGRNLFAAPSMICKKLGFQAGRPIIASLSDQLVRELIKHVPDFLLFNAWFQSKLGIAGLDPVCVPANRRTPFTPVHCPTGVVCRHCGWVKDDVDTFYRHPCTKAPITEEDEITVTSDENVEMVEKWYQSLTTVQKHVVDWALHGVNQFLTGYAGSGKTRCIHTILAKLRIKYGCDRVLSVSYTKAAANAVKGASIHSFLNLRPNDNMETITSNRLVSSVKAHPRKHAAIMSLQTLVIDEVSLVHGTFLDALSDALGRLRNRVNEPFGGIQVILCGDIMQLPPIGQSASTPDFFFRAQIWVNRVRPFRIHYLTKIHRQSKYFGVLNRIRVGLATQEDIDFLNSVCGSKASRDIMELIIECMYNLNIEDFHSKPFTHVSKLKKRIIDGRCGYFEEESNTYITSNVSSENLKSELDGRPFGKNTSVPKEPLLKLFANHFVVGMENAEGKAIGNKLQELLLSKEGKDLVGKMYKCDAVDTFYTYQRNSDVSLNDAASLLERNPGGHAFVQKKEQPFQYTDLAERPSSLLLYEGQLVILGSNGIDKLAANNSTGIVKGFKFADNDPKSIEAVYVQLLGTDSAVKQPIVTVRRDFKITSDKLTLCRQSQCHKLVLRHQFPLSAAHWATGYTVQGMTLSDLILVFNNIRMTKEKCGMLYVLLSRMTDIANFCTVRPLHPDDIAAHPIAELFDRFHEQYAEETEQMSYEVPYDSEFVQNRFVCKNTNPLLRKAGDAETENVCKPRDICKYDIEGSEPMSC